MDPHLSFKSTNALVLRSRVAETTLATNEVVSPARNERANVELGVKGDKMTGPATDIVTGIYTLFRLLS